MLPTILRPRVYLDTALLLWFSDGKHPDLFATVLNLLSASQAVLVLSRAHVLDIASAADESTIARVLDTLDRFPAVAIATSAIVDEQRKVDAILTGDSSGPPHVDISLRITYDLRMEPEFHPTSLKMQRVVRSFIGIITKSIHAAKVSDAELRSELGPNRVRDLHGDVFRDLFQGGSRGNPVAALERRLVSAGVSRDAVTRFVAPVEHLMKQVSNEGIYALLRSGASELDIDPRVVDLIASRLSERIGEKSVLELGIDAMMNDMKRLGGTDDTWLRTVRRASKVPTAAMAWAAVPGGDAKWHEHAPREAPGLYLQNVAPFRRIRDRAARPRDSDWADDQHLSFLPYVDIATVDGAVHSRISPTLDIIRKKDGFRRLGRILKNGDRDALAAALYELL